MKLFLKILLPLLVIIVLFYIISSNFFKTTLPEIQANMYLDLNSKVAIDSKNAWNPKRKIEILMSHDSEIASYSIKATTQDGIVILNQSTNIPKRSKEVIAWLPTPSVSLPNGTRLTYEITARSLSVFGDLQASRTFELTLNRENPKIDIIAQNKNISFGASALVIFRVSGIDIRKIEVSNGVKTYKPYPFLEDGYYAILLPWSLNEKNFKGQILARDSAFNTSKVTIPFIMIKPVAFKKTIIKISDEFLDTKLESLIANVGSTYPYNITSNIDKFRYVNEKARINDDEEIKKAISSNVEKITNLTPFFTFSPLKRSMAVGSFGDSRTYVSQSGDFITQTQHLGIDLASVKNDKIYSSNAGVVVLSKRLGIHGNTVIIDHGFGLFSLYAHLEEAFVKVGDLIEPESVIGLTGQTGWALGDHLHFGLIVQDSFIGTWEWRSTKWVNEINEIIKEAKQIIELSR